MILGCLPIKPLVALLLALFLALTIDMGDSVSEIEPIISFEDFRIAKRGLKGLMVVPGVGREDRLATLVESLRLLYPYLKGDTSQWDCVVYVYAPRSDSTFWSSSEDIKYVRSVCDMVENPKKRVTDNMRSVQPSLIKKHYSHVFILLDDCKLVPSSTHSLSWDLQKIIDLMLYNGLTVATPRIDNANTGGGQQFRKIMQAETLKGTEGYISSFLEVFAWVMTIEAYEIFWKLLLPEVNPYGWGYDFWYNGFAQTVDTDKKYKHKMGVVTTMMARHEQSIREEDNGATDGRAESATVKEKWGAVVEQEKYFKKYFDIDLKSMSSKMELANMSWNGAVKGYLHPVPMEYAKVKIGPSGTKNSGQGRGKGGRMKRGPKRGTRGQEHVEE